MISPIWYVGFSYPGMFGTPTYPPGSVFSFTAPGEPRDLVGVQSFSSYEDALRYRNSCSDQTHVVGPFRRTA